MRSRGTSRLRFLAGAAIAGQLLFTASWVLAGALERGYSPWRQGVSELGALNARHPWIANAGLLVLGLSIACLALALRAVLPPRRASLAAATLFLIAGVALMLTGVFRLDCGLSSHLCRARFDAGQLSWHTSTHVWAGLIASVALVLTPFAIARALWPSPTAALALGAGGFGVALAIAGEIAYQASAPDGISERLQLLAAHSWVVLVAGAVLYLTRQAPKLSHPTALRPRDFFAASWAGDGEVAAWAPLLGRFIRARFNFTRDATYLSDEVWMFDDRATFPGGNVIAQRLICQLEPDGHIHVSGDYVRVAVRRCWTIAAID